MKGAIEYFLVLGLYFLLTVVSVVFLVLLVSLIILQ